MAKTIYLWLGGVTLAVVALYWSLPVAGWLFVLLVPAWLLALHDSLQTEHTLRRNYPLKVLHEYRMTRKDIRATIAYIQKSDLEDLRSRTGTSAAASTASMNTGWGVPDAYNSGIT